MFWGWLESKSDAFQQVHWYASFQYETQKFDSYTQRKHKLQLAELIKCSVFRHYTGILSHPHWRKQWYFDIVIDNTNIIGNTVRGKLESVFSQIYLFFLELFYNTFFNKVHRVFKIVELRKGIKKKIEACV